jgi:hypothetical protein
LSDELRKIIAREEDEIANLSREVRSVIAFTQ